MVHDTLATLLRVRQLAVDEARQALAASIDAATTAAQAARSAEHAIISETEHASEPDGSDQRVEAFAAWVPRARHRLAQAVARLEREEAEVARCRADLAASRTALETLVQLRQARQKARADLLARQDQRELDDLSRRQPDDP